jgi:hypothetical protein
MDDEDLLAIVGSTWLETEHGEIGMIGITALELVRDRPYLTIAGGGVPTNIALAGPCFLERRLVA